MDLLCRKEASAPEIGETFVTAQYGAGVVSPDIPVRVFDVLHAVCTFLHSLAHCRDKSLFRFRMYAVFSKKPHAKRTLSIRFGWQSLMNTQKT